MGHKKKVTNRGEYNYHFNRHYARNYKGFNKSLGKKERNIFFGVFAVFLGILFFLFFSKFSFMGFTGQAVLSLDNIGYDEVLTGNFEFVLQQSELIPENTDIIISFSSDDTEVEEYSYSLNEILNAETTEGYFFLKDKSLFNGSEFGKGFGLSSERFPSVDFVLGVYDVVQGRSYEIPEQTEESGDDTSSEDSKEVVKDENIGTRAIAITGGMIKGFFARITGQSTLDLIEEVSGSVKYGEEFVYDINSNQQAEIISSEQEVNLQVENSKAIVTTNYIGDESIVYSVLLDELDIPVESGELNVKFVYDGEVLFEKSREISSEIGNTYETPIESGTRTISSTEIDNCTTISTSGIYNVNQSVNTSGATCFIINSNDTILDCQGNLIYNNGSKGGSKGAWVYASDLSTLHNVTVRNCSFERFLQSISFGNVANGTIYNNTFINQSGAIELYDGSQNITIENNYVSGTYDDSIDGIEVTDNSVNNTIKGNTVEGILYGIFLRNANFTTITNNTIQNNSYCGVLIYYSASEQSWNNTVYNNFLNQSESSQYGNANDDAGVDTGNLWNTTLDCTGVSNIIGGTCIGGNYWSDYAGYDSDGDGIGDTELPHNSTNNISYGGDYLPLTYNALPVVQEIFVNSSLGTNTTDENLTCWINTTDAENHALNYTGYWYRNGTQNISINASNNYASGSLVNISLLNSGNTSVGDNWSCYIRAFDGTNYSSYSMSDNLTILGLIPPNVTINTPLNQTYYTVTIDFNITATDDSSVDSCWFTLDSGVTNYTMFNTTYVDDYNYTNSSMAEGSYQAEFYCNDSSNNINNSESVVFYVNNNTAPVMQSVSINSSNEENKTNEDLYCWANSSDVDSDNLTYFGEWYRNGLAFVNETWAVSYDSGSTDYAWDIDADGSGNLYVTGNHDANGNHDYYTIKYNSSGSQIWNATYDGGEHDWGISTTFDSSGNVYVTGYSDNATGSEDYDYHTIKYNSSGDHQWNVSSDSGGVDNAYGVAVDSSGNVYVTGSGNYNYFTIKYDSSGNHVWNVSYDSGGTEGAHDIALDNLGNIYVTGYVDNGPNDDIYTIKYNSVGGVVWSKTYNSGNDERGEDIRVDGLGNVYVTGHSNNDYYTIKYDSSGNHLWNATYDSGGVDRAFGLDLDGANNVYIGGYVTNTNADYCVVKYNNSGSYIWNATYDSGNGDVGESVAVDDSGNVYISGYGSDGLTNNYLTVKFKGGFIIENQTQAILTNVSILDSSYTSAGDNWSCSVKSFDSVNYSNELFSGNITILALNNVSSVEGVSINSSDGGNKSNEDLMCWANITDDDGDNITYFGEWYRNGSVFVDEYWNETLGDTSSDIAKSIVVDSSENVYVTGYTNSFGEGGYDVWLLKYNSSGSLLWNKTEGGTEADRGWDITIDSSDNIYVVGDTVSFAPDANNTDLWLLKYDSSGNYLWNITCGGSDYDYGYGITLDSSGNIYTAGQFKNSTGDYFWLVKYNSSGGQLWNATIGGSGWDIGRGVDLDSLGNIYISGSTYSFGAGAYDLWTVKYDSDGNYIWNRTIGGTSDDYGIGVKLDSFDNVYAGGSTQSFAANSAYWLIKYDSDGNYKWNVTAGGTGADQVYGIDIDSANNIYLTGRATSVGAGGWDYWTLKYNSSGDEIWNKTAGGTDNDYGYGISVDSIGNVYVTGYTQSFGAGNSDFWTIKYKDGFVLANQIQGILTNVSTLDSSFTTVGDDWSCGISGFDNYNYSSFNFTGNLTVLASAVCGNGIVETGEQCDGSDLNGSSCSDFGYDSGVLGCSASCTFDTSSCTASSCFPAGTEILMANGFEKNIEDVQINDEIMSYDFEDNKKKSALVLELESPIREGYYKINNLINVTDEHPFYVLKNEMRVWAAIDKVKSKIDLISSNSALKNENIFDLEIGDKLFTSNGKWIEVKNIEYVPGKIQTYNLKSVEGNVFFANNILVHNKGCTPDCSGKECGDDGCGGSCGSCDEGEVCSSGVCIVECEENWSCSEWGDCVENVKTRVCTDLNSCGTEVDKPSETQSCDCIEDWECEWTSCDSDDLYSYSYDCVDLNSCGTEFDKPVKKACSGVEEDDDGCDSDWECEEWGECESEYTLDDVLQEKVEVDGIKRRTCVDLNGCDNDKIEKRTCSVFIPVYAERVEWCDEDYIEIYERDTRKLVSRIRENEQIGLTSDKLYSLDISFVISDFSGYCDYCYDNEKNYDETGVDCGGDSCPACIVGVSFFNWVPILSFILWSLIVLSSVYIVFDRRQELVVYFRELKRQDIGKKIIVKLKEPEPSHPPKEMQISRGAELAEIASGKTLLLDLLRTIKPKKGFKGKISSKTQAGILKTKESLRKRREQKFAKTEKQKEKDKEKFVHARKIMLKEKPKLEFKIPKEKIEKIKQPKKGIKSSKKSVDETLFELKKKDFDF